MCQAGMCSHRNGHFEGIWLSSIREIWLNTFKIAPYKNLLYLEEELKHNSVKCEFARTG